MKTVEAPILEPSLERGITFLKNGEPWRSLGHFTGISGQPSVNRAVVVARQMTGIAFRQIGQPERSVDYLQEALQDVDAFEDPLLKAQILSDLGASLHAVAVLRRKSRKLDLFEHEDLLYEAECSFEESLSILKRLCAQFEVASDDQYKAVLAEFATIKGLLGFLQFDRGDSGSHVGRNLIKRASKTLEKLGEKYKTYHLNTVMRLMLTSDLGERFKLWEDWVYDRTNKTSQFVSLRPRTRLALFNLRSQRKCLWAEKGF